MNFLKYLLLILLLAYYIQVFGQDPDTSQIAKMINSPEDTAVIDGYNEYCWHYKYSDPDTAIFFGEKALSMAKQLEYPYGIAKAYNNIGIVHWGLGNYDSAVTYLTNANQTYRKMNFQKGICVTLINIGMLKQNLAMIPESIDDLLNALRLQEKLGIEAYRAPIIHNLGNSYYLMEDFLNAKKYYLESYRMKKKTGSSSLYRTEMNLGVAYQKLGNADSAMLLYQKALSEAIEKNSWLTIQELYVNIGTIHAERGKYPQALSNYLKAEELLEKKVSNEVDATILLVRISESYRLTGDYQKAKNFAIKSLELAIEVSNNLRIQAAFMELYEISRAQNDFRSSLDYFQSFVQYRDSVFSLEKENAIAELQTQYETEKKEQELKVLKASSELQAIELAQTRNLIVIVVLLAAFILLAISLLNSRRRHKLKARLADEKKQLQKTRFKAVIDAEEKERKRIARELHDGLGQLLSTARLTISSLDEDEEDPKIQNSINLIDTAVQEVRSISHNMMPNALTAYGLEAALHDLVLKINQAEKIEVKLDKETTVQLDESKSVAVYRVVQEVLNNAIKYSQASEILLLITEIGSELSILIKDDGNGFDTDEIRNSSGIGWSNIYSRMELIGGQVSVFSKVNEGTTVKLLVPLEQDQKSLAS